MTKKLPFFKKKSIRRVGLDIGSYNLKVVEIESRENSASLINLAMKEIRNVQDISSAITQLLQDAQIDCEDVNICLSGDNVVARYLSMPKMSEEELKKAIVYELEDHIPFKPEEVYTDCRILGDEESAQNRMRVFLVATKKNFLEERIEIVRKVGLIPQVVTTDALALKNTFYCNYPEKENTNVALLNVGDKITNILIAHQKIPYFVRDTHFGGDAITALIKTKLNVEQNKAEELKYNLKDAPEDLLQLIKSAFANLLNEIFVSLDFYENLTEQRIDEVFICGGSAQLAGLKDFLGGYLGLSIQDLAPFKIFSSSTSISPDTLAKLSPYFAVAIGAALEEP
jgi:type IV pilus assembly protein PilM